MIPTGTSWIALLDVLVERLGALSPVTAYIVLGYLLLRLLLPVALVVIGARGATPKQRVKLVSHYLSAVCRSRRR